MKIDQLNRLMVRYYDVMNIPKEEKKKRVGLAIDLFDVFYYILLLINTDIKYNHYLDIQGYKDTLDYRVRDILEEKDLPYDESYTNKMTTEIIDTTFKHINDNEVDDEYFLSEDRAVVIAQNETNTVLNDYDYRIAKQNGKQYKTWRTELDDKVRATHFEVEGVRIPIDDFFYVGRDRMRYPHDYMNGSPENLINCRCVCEYT